MYLNLHDDDVGNTLVVGILIDYAYQAERWVLDTSKDADKDVVKWILYDLQGPVCIWERSGGSTDIPLITHRAERFTGTWEKGPAEFALLTPTEGVTLHVHTLAYQEKDDEDNVTFDGTQIIGEVKRGEDILHRVIVTTNNSVTSVCENRDDVAYKIEHWAVENTNFMPTADALAS